MKNTLKVIGDIILILICIVGAYFLSNWLFATINVDGTSMEQTLHDGDAMILYKQGQYKVGDIVVFNTHIKGTNGDRHYVKRIIALEGDTVEIKADETGAYYIYVNDVKLEEEYLSEGIVNARELDAHGKITVPPGKFYYCGDNRLNSADSRSSQQFGSYEDIVGRVIFKYNPEEGVLKDLEPVKRP